MELFQTHYLRWIANCDVVKPKVVAAEHISQFNEEAHSSFVKK
ncbi:hypothetical protein HanRHA438_Chr10g0460961 [Helianthus annuus]|uniref:Uncharacterized protein n=1 Tax=Helianthus annuus TaxID=4232 RepID=A0A9K3HZ61_HELAN|nr:hypothetical protein HanXRQr2_Chr10g0448421 [Helianthus annuus]KAJ0880244.1 hypothetical protein HanRHA438_Chr10g0460961 [Helianthus annuus]